LQAALAWVVSLSALAAVLKPRPWHWIDSLGLVLVVFGTMFEAMAGWRAVAPIQSPRGISGKGHRGTTAWFEQRSRVNRCSWFEDDNVRDTGNCPA